MTTRTMALLNPSMLRWARERAGFTVDEAAERIGIKPDRLAAAEDGSGHLTLRQAETAAQKYGRPLATFYLPQPPSEQTTETRLRQLPDAPSPPWPRDVALLVRRLRERQDDAIELYELLGESSPWQQLTLQFSEDVEVLAPRVREALGISVAEQKSWRDASCYVALRNWVMAVERVGGLVVQGSSAPIDLLRGLASPDPIAPGVFLHSQDAPGARVFTLLHEFGHLVLARAGRDPHPRREAWCNELTAEVLMPRGDFGADFAVLSRRVPDLLSVVDALATLYGVTSSAVVVRAENLALVGAPEAGAVREVIAHRSRRRPVSEVGGGDYYRTQVSRLSRNFTRLVFSALDAQVVSYPEASAMLGVKVSNFPRLRDAAAGAVPVA